MKIAIHDQDATGFPNLALMKLSAWHKSVGDSVEWFFPLNQYDRVYSSKVFTWTKPDEYLPTDTIRGGTGYSLIDVLPEEAENIFPDYSIYPECDYALGFLTRGCIRKCTWCFVPKKEGAIRPNAKFEDIARRDTNNIVFMDNNVLSCEHGLKEIERLGGTKYKVDFNQGLDARLIDDSVSKLLSKLKWYKPIRLACDSIEMIEPVRKAVESLRWNNVTPSCYFCYVLVDDVEKAKQIVRFLKGIHVDPFCQPFRDEKGTEPTDEQKAFSRWVDHKAIFKTVQWEDYK